MKKTKWLFIIFSMLSTNAYSQGKWYGMGVGYQAGGAYAICPDTVNNILYVGGGFNGTGGPGEHHLLKWNGNNWDTTFYISNKQGYVDALVMFNGKLYMGLSSGDTLGGVLSYDGISHTSLGSFDGPIKCLAVYHDTLFAAGSFGTDNFGDVIYNIAKWNGSKWLPVDSGVWLYYICCPEINALTVYNGQLIAGGIFDHAGGNWNYGVAAYDGLNWHPLQGGVGDSTKGGIPGVIESLEVYNGKLYAGGDFSIVNDSTAYELASWDGSSWNSIKNNLSGESIALKSFDGYLFIGGDAGLNKQFFYKFDGTNESTVDSGANSDVYSLNSWGHSLYVGGIFDTVSKSIFSQGIARWTPDVYSGINQFMSANIDYIVYPNPTSGELNIQSEKYIDQIKVMDLLGQVIYQAQPKQFQFSFQLNETGMYFITITSGGEVVTKMVMVSK